MAQYRFALDFLALSERAPILDAVLNDHVPELGLPAGTYDAYKLRFLNALLGTEFALLAALRAALPYDPESAAEMALDQAVEEDEAALWSHGFQEGPVLTAGNALATIWKTALRTWLPVQKRASLLLSHLRLPVRNRWHISLRRARRLLPRLRPGDILLQRREWAFTNLGLPGFWTHAALFIGTPSERNELALDPSVAAWVESHVSRGSSLESVIAHSNLEAYGPAALAREDGNPARVIEALAPGVLLTSLERSLACDGVAVLRPRLPAVAKAAAIARAFHFVGRPYDFAFDYASDSALVCSELVLKAYEPQDGLPGLTLPLREIAGHRVVPPNEFARIFEKERGRDDAQFELVVFLDGIERRRRVVEAGEETFLTSWRRPKWHVLTQ